MDGWNGCADRGFMSDPHTHLALLSLLLLLLLLRDISALTASGLQLSVLFCLADVYFAISGALLLLSTVPREFQRRRVWDRAYLVDSFIHMHPFRPI